MRKAQRFKLLLESGYFPQELPPPFNTKQLARWRASIIAKWNALPDSYPKARHEVYSIPKQGSVRRNLHIPNPITQVFLSYLIAENWVRIRSHLRQSKYAAEPLDLSDNCSRAVPTPDGTLLTLRRVEISASYDHALRADISRFYGTLYTHAIPWALESKAWCKQNLNTAAYSATLGAQLDKAVRKGQDNQTIGIPVGPDTSRIISEIVAVAVDSVVQQQLCLDHLRAFRHVDDWHIGFDNASEAEAAIATLATACRTFELEINPEKTKLLNTKTALDKTWPSDLRDHKFPPTRAHQLKSLEYYSSKAFHYANGHPEDNVLGYAVSRTKGVKFRSEVWHSYESFLLRCVRANRSTLSDVVQILVSYNAEGFELGKDRIGKLIEDLVLEGVPPANHAEVAWALFLAKVLRIEISAEAGRAVSGMESSVCALLALDLESQNLTSAALNKDLWQQSMIPSGLLSELWMLAYEAQLKGWLTGNPATFIEDNEYFRELLAHRVSFYDINKNVTDIRKEKPRSPSAARLEFLGKLRGHREDNFEDLSLP